MPNPAPMEDEQLPPTQYEKEQAAHAIVTRQNDRRERIVTARANRAAGNPEPKAGDKLFVIPERGIKHRSRAGLRFDGTSGKRTPIDVVDLDDGQVLVEQRRGKLVVNPWGAEQIIADNALTVHQSPAIEQDVERLNSENVQLRVELDAMRAAAAKAKAVRDARRDAKDPGDGSSSRLPAGRAVEGAPAAAAGETDEFGAPARK